MREQHDKETGASYYEFSDNVVVSTKTLTETVNVDVDKHGNVVGIEILEPHKNN